MKYSGGKAVAYKRWYEKNRPTPLKTCGKCSVEFKPSNGPQKYCDGCRTLTCAHCSVQFIPATRRLAQRCCSRRCAALSNPETIAKLQANRGRKPRTYAARRDKHGSAEDREWRVAVFERDSYTCQMCGERGGRLQADHIKPFSTHPDLRHVLSNGRTLCVPCHQQTDTYGWRGYWMKVRAGKIAARRLDQMVLPFDGA